MRIESGEIRRSAEGEMCTLNIVGVCSYDETTTVLTHFPDESHGMSLKAIDISAGYGCGKCHDVIDGRVKHEFEPGERDWYMRRSQTRTLIRLIEKGIITIL